LSKIEIIKKKDVIEIHNRLVIDAVESDDPISPPGIKNEGLCKGVKSSFIRF